MEETQLTERELSRKANWRLAIIRHAQEVSGNVAFTCRYYGVNRQSYYKWLRLRSWASMASAIAHAGLLSARMRPRLR
jgi:transposase-like protein